MTANEHDMFTNILRLELERNVLHLATAGDPEITAAIKNLGFSMSDVLMYFEDNRAALIADSAPPAVNLAAFIEILHALTPPNRN